ncbi:MAG: ABC transporter substrate-binding protein [Bacillota bacterium]
MRISKLMLLTALLGLILSIKVITGWEAASGKSELVILQGSIPESIDPAVNSTLENALPITGVYEGLVRLNPETLNPEPCLSDSWEVSDDGKRWTFYLKPGIQFSDGTACDAEAVKASMSRVMALQESQPYASLIFGPVSSIETGERYTVSFILKQPFAPFLKNLALPLGAPVVSPAALKKYGDDFWKHPSGTGPYIFVQSDKNKIVLQSNPRYRGSPPSINRVVVKAVPDPSARTRLLLDRKADIIYRPGPDQTEKLRAGGMRITSLPGLDVSYLGFYTDRPPLDNKYLRYAIAYALDRDRIVADALRGEGVPAAGLLPPPISTLKKAGSKLSPDQVRRILSREGYPGGISLTLIAYEDPRRYCPPGGTALAEEIRRQLEPAGITINIQSLPWEKHKEAIRNKTGDFFLYGWTGDNGDPDNFLYTLLSSSQIDQGLNASGYKNDKLDVYLVTARRVSDPKSRDLLYRQAENIIMEEVPVAPINHGIFRIAHSSAVKDIKITGLGLLNLYTVRKL